MAQPVERFLTVDPARRYDLALLDPPYELEVAPVLTVLTRGSPTTPWRRSSAAPEGPS